MPVGATAVHPSCCGEDGELTCAVRGCRSRRFVAGKCGEAHRTIAIDPPVSRNLAGGSSLQSTLDSYAMAYILAHDQRVHASRLTGVGALHEELLNPKFARWAEVLWKASLEAP